MSDIGTSNPNLPSGDQSSESDDLETEETSITLGVYQFGTLIQTFTVDNWDDSVYYLPAELNFPAFIRITDRLGREWPFLGTGLMVGRVN